MKNFGNTIEYKQEDILGSQHGSGQVGEEALKKELGENSFAKAAMIELLVDKLVGQLSLPENYKIIDEAVGEEGVSQELANKLWEYSEKLGAKNITPNSGAKDFLGNLETALLGAVFSIKNAKSKERREKKFNNFKEAIKEDFIFLKDYLDLLLKNNNFERAELGDKFGFLNGKISKEDLENLRKRKGDYLRECSRIVELDKRKN